MDSKELIHQYLLGNLAPQDVEELDRRLAASDELRKYFTHAAEMDAVLHKASVENSIGEVHAASAENATPSRSTQNVPWRWATAASIAASLLMLLGWWAWQPSAIATLTSSEDAAWESTLPTNIGAELTSGTLNLRTGIATIEFGSGAEFVLEAPAQLELVSTMRAKLLSGQALINVPPSAIGFVLETPEGYAIDFGTRFAVNVDQKRKASDFQLIEGEIEVHHPATGKSVRLDVVGTGASVSVDAMQLTKSNDLADSAQPVLPEGSKNSQTIRVSTNGRHGVALGNENARSKIIRPEYLYAKNSYKEKFMFRSFFEFDLAGVETVNLEDAKLENVILRLNQVESYLGSASLLPKINRFKVYGLTNPDKENWGAESTWEQAPGPMDGVLLATFEIPRSQQRGMIEIASPELLAFLKERRDQRVTFVLVRETKRLQGIGASLTHMFASDQHPEAVGPLLEITVQD